MAKKQARVASVPTLASVHRFRDVVGVYASRDNGTLYLSADEAKRFGEALLRAAQSIRTESFLDSNVPQYTLTDGES